MTGPGLVKGAARFALHQMGGLRLLRNYHRSGLRIAMYHKFSAPHANLQEALERQLTAFAQRYRVISLSDAARTLEIQGAFLPNSLVITVDDGYRDFFEVAFPVLKKLGLPATVYLVSGFLDGQLWLWTDQVAYLCGERGVEVSLGGGAKRRYSARQLIEPCKTIPNEERLAVLASLPSLLGARLPDQPPAGCRPLHWDEVRTMAQHGIEFGAHTSTHPILSRLSQPSEIRAEIEHSQGRIAEELGRSVEHFCYPNGQDQDFNEAAVTAVQQLGFRTAVTTSAGINQPSSPRFLLRRFGMEPESPLPYALERLEGLHDAPQGR